MFDDGWEGENSRECTLVVNQEEDKVPTSRETPRIDELEAPKLYSDTIDSQSLKVHLPGEKTDEKIKVGKPKKEKKQKKEKKKSKSKSKKDKKESSQHKTEDSKKKKKKNKSKKTGNKKGSSNQKETHGRSYLSLNQKNESIDKSNLSTIVKKETLEDLEDI